MKILAKVTSKQLALVEKELELSLPDGTIGLANYTEGDKLAAVVVFTPPVHGSSSLHVVALRRHWLTPEFCEKIFRFGFGQVGAIRLTALVEAGNPRCLNLVHKVGFQLEGVMRGFTFGDLLVFGMMKRDCKWVNSLT